ncbi:cyclin-domain-containing protein [Violaceomyces palustris]|uniref:Cyclin-domain-containing protein n=1 Tax=Violaceomyces palustris TaxID=1673888 RepID=A0ACD0NTJ5_9BASI|nr:cyclin-domain-containing protein [Violaceomyces palustris]
MATYEGGSSSSSSSGRWETGVGMGAMHRSTGSGDESMPDRSAHGIPSHFYSTSPEGNRGPAPKTRRTSPGGSRASDAARQGDGGKAPGYPTGQPEAQGGYPRWQQEASSDPQNRSHGYDPRAEASSIPSRLGCGRAASGESSLASTSVAEGSNRTTPTPQQASDAAPNAAPRSQVWTAPTAAPPDPYSGHESSMPPPREEPPSKSQGPRVAPTPRLDLATFPPQDLLKVLATLLHQIATANDELRPSSGQKEDTANRRSGKRSGSGRSRDQEESGDGSDAIRPPADARESREDDSAGGRGASGEPSIKPQEENVADSSMAANPPSHLSFDDQRRSSITTAALGALSIPSSTLCFHARNVPSISIESYLLRILKYCPTTNEVFLSLLVYFDRMSRMGLGAAPGSNDGSLAGEAAGLPRAAQLAASCEDGAHQDGTSSSSLVAKGREHIHPGIKGFAIDSYNVHRLVIAGVTVASKFFSDVFYTNSRYAKVGGLPVHELNQLELQFLLLNDFRLTIPLEEMQRYADQLLAYGSGAGQASVTPDPYPKQSSDPQARQGREASPTASRDQQGDVRMRDA